MKKILVISPRPTHKPTTGARKCILDYCTLLQEMGFEVYFFHIKDQVKEPFWNNLDYLETKNYWGDHYFELYSSNILQFIRWSFCNFIKLYHIFFRNNYFCVDQFYDPYLRYKINRLQKKYHFQSVIINYVWLSKSLEKIKIPNKIIFTHDVFLHKTISQRVKSQSLTPSAESKALRRCPKIFAIQNNEAILFKYLAPQSKIYTVYSPTQYIDQDLTYNDNILFLSGTNKFNIIGIQNFIDNVFPLILDKYSNVKLLIGGTICNVFKNKYLHPNIQFVGEVDSIYDFYKQGDIVINPVFLGSGLKIKTIEAMSFGKTTIVHPHSIDGIYDVNNVPLISCSTPEIYAVKVIECLQDKMMRVQMKEKCKNYIKCMNDYIHSQFRQALMD